jgi:hypothetical protein
LNKSSGNGALQETHGKMASGQDVGFAVFTEGVDTIGFRGTAMSLPGIFAQ